MPDDPIATFNDDLSMVDPADQRLLRRAAELGHNILLTGEVGVGKSRLARTIHGIRENQTEKPSPPFIHLNISSLSPEIFESELFGHEQGAFTHAIKKRDGYIKKAEASTILLDEIGDLELHLQAKILHILEEKEYYPVGSGTVHKVDNIQFIFATHKDLPSMVKAGTFRDDLYSRINFPSFKLLPLRQCDHGFKLGLLNAWIKDWIKKEKIQKASLPRVFQDSAALLNTIDAKHYSWPYNIREFKKVIDFIRLYADAYPSSTLADVVDHAFRKLQETQVGNAPGGEDDCFRSLVELKKTLAPDEQESIQKVIDKTACLPIAWQKMLTQMADTVDQIPWSETLKTLNALTTTMSCYMMAYRYFSHPDRTDREKALRHVRSSFKADYRYPKEQCLIEITHRSSSDQ